MVAKELNEAGMSVVLLDAGPFWDPQKDFASDVLAMKYKPSLENSPSTHALKLPVGDLVILNNTFWLHGRAAFEQNPQLHRELMRQRGVFVKV